MALVCSECASSIESRDDLVVAMEFISMTPYCSSCWAKSQKTIMGQEFVGMPLNGSFANLGAIIAGILLVIFLFYKEYGYAALCAISLLFRFLAFWFYERKLE
jgi:hypothetical protein